MKQNAPSELSDQETIDKPNNTKLAPWASALLIGFLIGIIIYSVAVNSIGFFTLIPLYFIYRMIKMKQE